MALPPCELHHHTRWVTDLACAKQFYVDTLGFEPVLDFPGGVIVNAYGKLISIRGGVF